eukprot:gene2590-3002_t
MTNKYGFAIHGCIDGWSRRIIWLYVTRSNNFPSNIAAYYLEAVQEIGGCPTKIVTDLGTENGLVAGIQSFFRNDPDSHKYVPFPRNQRIEGWWSFLRKGYSGWWINFFKDLEESGNLNLADPLEKECLWPDYLFHVPESRGCHSYLVPVPENEITYARSHLIKREDSNAYLEYFEYLQEYTGFDVPRNWREALNLFQSLLSIAKGDDA